MTKSPTSKTCVEKMKMSYTKPSVFYSPNRRMLRTDSNRVCAECPKMKEKPRMIVANGTSDAIVSLLLKMRSAMKVKTTSTQATKTASNFATALPTSCPWDKYKNRDTWYVTNVPSSWPSTPFSPGKFSGQPRASPFSRYLRSRPCRITRMLLAGEIYQLDGSV